jgi:monomeric isocitrate dehydrogenase
VKAEDIRSIDPRGDHQYLKCIFLQEIAAQLADLVAEVRDIKADMQRADEQVFGVNKP